MPLSRAGAAPAPVHSAPAQPVHGKRSSALRRNARRRQEAAVPLARMCRGPSPSVLCAGTARARQAVEHPLTRATRRHEAAVPLARPGAAQPVHGTQSRPPLSSARRLAGGRGAAGARRRTARQHCLCTARSRALPLTTARRRQEAAVPLARAGADLVVQAKSGTGKTAVFGIAAVERARLDLPAPQVAAAASPATRTPACCLPGPRRGRRSPGGRVRRAARSQPCGAPSWLRIHA